MTEERSADGRTSLADRIREFVWREQLEPVLSRSAGAVAVVRAGDVHQRMHLKARLPAVCAALDSKIMTTRYGVEVVKREGPPQGANAIIHFARSAGRQPPRKQPFEPKPQPSTRPSSRAEPSPPARHAASADTVFLVSCVKTKRNAACAAKDLYASDWFESARAYVEGQSAPWLILSAEYGLVNPDQVIEPYEKTLKTMPIDERRRWAERVVRSCDAAVLSACRVVFLAGASYREFLVPLLADRGLSTEAPLSSMRQGEQLSWLKRNGKHHPA